MKGKIIAGKILVGDIIEKKETVSGIVYNTETDFKQLEGTVALVGEQAGDEKIEVKPGDKIIFLRGVGNNVEIKEKKYKLIFHRDILYIG